MIIHDHEQGSEAWFSARRGIPTASGFSKILTATGKPSTSATAYMYSLIAERLSGAEVDQFTNEWMERGKELESEARDLFRFATDIDMPEVGFITDDEITIGCSPDGWNGDIGLEIKCPKASTHVKYMLGSGCPADYVPQVQGSMFVTGASHWWFVSYYPGLDPVMCKVAADPDWHSAFAAELTKFNRKMTDALAKLDSKAA